jgi:polyisoprenoid-binding protein YceI
LSIVASRSPTDFDFVTSPRRFVDNPLAEQELAPLSLSLSLASEGDLMVKSALFALGFILAGGVAHAEVHRYEMDKDHTLVEFTWNHNRLANFSGRFLDFDGAFDLDFTEPANSRVDFTIQAESVWTGVAALDADMRSPRLFNAAEHPAIRFVSREARQTGLDRGQLIGDLTIKGVTRPVTLYLDVNYQGPHHFAESVERYRHALVAGITGRARISRSEFGLGMAVPWIADEIDIRIETELVAFPRGRPAQ